MVALMIIVIITGSFIFFATLKQPITTTPPPQSPLISLPSRGVEGHDSLGISKSIVMKDLEIPGTTIEIKSYTLLNFRKSKHSNSQMALSHVEFSVGETILGAAKSTIVKISFYKKNAYT